MNLPTIAELTEALEKRARNGRDVSAAQALHALAAVRARLSHGADAPTALDEVLWEVVRATETPHLVSARGGHGHTPEALRCYLAVYSRLDVSSALQHNGLAKGEIFPKLSSRRNADRTKRGQQRSAYEQLRKYHRDEAGWAEVEAAMSYALTVTKEVVENKWARLAPSILAGELLRHEAEFQLQSARLGLAGQVAEAEERLERAGLLASYVRTPPVVAKLRELEKLLKEPENGYVSAGKDFKFVIAQLDTTYHTLRGISSPKDDTVASNPSYFAEQLRVLIERGISIERVFLYEKGREDESERLARQQRQHAATAIEEAQGTSGSYNAFLVARSIALDVFRGEDYSSIAIIDAGEPTQRVVRMAIGPPNSFEVSSSHFDVERALGVFDTLKTDYAHKQPSRLPSDPGRVTSGLGRR